MTSNFDLYESALSSLYEAPTNPRAWLEFMRRFGRLIDTHGGQYHVWDAAHNRMGFSATTDEYPEKDTAYYNTHLAPNDPRRKLSEQEPAGRWIFDQEHFDARFVDRNEVFRWLNRFEIQHCAAVRLTDGNDMLSALALFRAPNQQPFGEFERHWLDRITPHIRRASQLHLRLESLRAQAHDGWQAANMLDYPVLVVNDAAQVRFANLAAEALLRLPRAPLRIAQGQLRGATPAAQEKLVTAVRHATAPDHRHGNMLAVQRELGAPAYQLVVLPAADHCELALPSDRPLALIVIGAPGQGRSVDAELLRQLFGLSDAEARVVVGLTQGSTLKQLADETGVSINTVRTQLQTVFSKTSTHRQAELVNLVAALPRVRR